MTESLTASSSTPMASSTSLLRGAVSIALNVDEDDDEALLQRVAAIYAGLLGILAAAPVPSAAAPAPPAAAPVVDAPAPVDEGPPTPTEAPPVADPSTIPPSADTPTGIA